MHIFSGQADRDWEKFGVNDPYYGVLTSDSYRREAFGVEARRRFFESGCQHISGLMERLEARLGPIKRGFALDFGCGVGRLTVPLASEFLFESVTGVDISPSMLNEARKNAGSSQLNNIYFKQSCEFFNHSDASFDFIHSYIVFQHIPRRQGMQIFGELLCRLSPGGVIAIHFPYSKRIGLLRTTLSQLRLSLRPVHYVGNVLQKRPIFEPPMQMNSYNINQLLLQCFNCGLVDISLELSLEGDVHGVYLFGRLPVGGA